MENETKKDAVLDVGQLVTRYFKERRTRRSVLARLLNVRRQTVANYMVRPQMKTEVMWNLSMTLKHNFFQDIAAMLPKDFTTYAKVDTTLNERIAELEEEIKVLKAENALMERLLK